MNRWWQTCLLIAMICASSPHLQAADKPPGEKLPPQQQQALNRVLAAIEANNARIEAVNEKNRADDERRNAVKAGRAAVAALDRAEATLSSRRAALAWASSTGTASLGSSLVRSQSTVLLKKAMKR